MSRVLLLCWRDSRHPQGGGSERYLEHVGAALAARGHEVVYRTSAVPGTPREEVIDGVRFSRAGGRFTVYPRALGALGVARLGYGPLRPRRGGAGFDAVVDTQNGVPFFASLISGAPTVLLVHHCHREQWPVAGAVVARLGWWIESRLSPRVHARNQYVTVSLPSADELAALGVAPDRTAVVRNGLDPLPDGVTAGSADARADGPRIVVLSRLVPHKHVEDALEVTAALRGRHPGLALDVIGDGWWSERLRRRAAEILPPDTVVFHGHLDDSDKHRVLARAVVHLLPSRKEGWGLAVMEAAQHSVPTIGYHHAVGLRDSIVDGVTGELVHDVAGMTDTCGRLLDHPDAREAMGASARDRAAGFSWTATGRAWVRVLDTVTEGRQVSGVVEATP